jgi:hypothetical protein
VEDIMSKATRPTGLAVGPHRAVRRALRRLVHTAWRLVRVLIVASAAMGPCPPPPPLPRPPPIEARADDGDPPAVERGAR